MAGEKKTVGSMRRAIAVSQGRHPCMAYMPVGTDTTHPKEGQQLPDRVAERRNASMTSQTTFRASRGKLIRVDRAAALRNKRIQN